MGYAGETTTTFGERCFPGFASGQCLAMDNTRLRGILVVNVLDAYCSGKSPQILRLDSIWHKLRCAWYVDTGAGASSTTC